MNEGTSGAGSRDLMIECIGARFGTCRAPSAVQWLTDNGSIYAAANDMAVALNLAACFTPVENPESNGIAEVFAKIFKRDYVRINPIPDARTALANVERWIEDYNEIHPHSASPSRRQGNTSKPHRNQPSVRSDGVDSNHQSPGSNM